MAQGLILLVYYKSIKLWSCKYKGRICQTDPLFYINFESTSQWTHLQAMMVDMMCGSGDSESYQQQNAGAGHHLAPSLLLLLELECSIKRRFFHLMETAHLLDSYMT